MRGRDVWWGEHYLPEPLDLLAVPGVVAIHGVFLPLPSVQVLHTTQHQL